MFNIDRNKVGSINDGGRKLKLGSHAYKITGASMAVVKSNPTGKEQQIIFDLRSVEDPSYNCKEFLNVMSPNTVACEIAQKTLVAFADAAGVAGVLKPTLLPKFIGKFVVIEAKSTTSKKDGKDYVNLATVEAYEGEEEEAEEETEETEAEEAEEEEDESEEDKSEEEEAPKEAPAAAPKKTIPAPGKKRPW